jgi:hypothetical protein
LSLHFLQVQSYFSFGLLGKKAPTSKKAPEGLMQESYQHHPVAAEAGIAPATVASLDIID